MNTDYKTGKLLQIIKEWEARGLSEFEISGTEISRAIFFYREANKKFVPIPKGSYTVTMLDGSKADKLMITNSDIQTKAVEYQICYEDEQISSLYIEDFPELDVLVGKYNDVVNDVRNIIQLLKTVGMKSDTSQMTQVLTKLQVNTFWYLNENGELDAFPIGDLNSKYQDMLENMKTNVEQTLNSVHQALKADLENLIRNYNTVVDQAKEHIDNTKKSAETSVNDKKNESINALNTLKQNLENQLNTLKNDLSSDLSRELQTHLQNLASSVNQYISNNRDILKGERGKGITSITSENDNIRINYDDNQEVVFTIPTIAGKDGKDGKNGKEIIQAYHLERENKIILRNDDNTQIECLLNKTKDLQQIITINSDKLYSGILFTYYENLFEFDSLVLVLHNDRQILFSSKEVFLHSHFAPSIFHDVSSRYNEEQKKKMFLIANQIHSRNDIYSPMNNGLFYSIDYNEVFKTFFTDTGNLYEKLEKENPGTILLIGNPQMFFGMGYGFEMFSISLQLTVFGKRKRYL